MRKKADHEQEALVRVRFEAWVRRIGFDIETTTDYTGTKKMVYLNPYLESMWKGWHGAYDNRLV
jgi:hypothetical protein